MGSAGSSGITVPKVTVVVPAFNEEAVVAAFHARLAATLDRLPQDFEILFVDDGSSDGTAARIRELRAADPRVALLGLSRNFGKEIAVTAGIDHAEGDAVILIDADLQDPPELIPELIAKWQEGFDVVYAQRLSRRGETWLKRLSAHLFYRFMERVGDRVTIPRDTGDYRLLNRRSLDALNRLREQHRFMKGLFAWIGYRQAAVPYHRDPRHASVSKWSYRRLWALSIEGITSFTIAPLKLATYLGLLVGLLSFLYAIWIIYKTLAFGESVAGYPSLMTAVLFLGGVQLVAIGIIGEYLGRVFNETKRRPLYLIQDYVPSGPEGGRPAAEGAGRPDDAVAVQSAPISPRPGPRPGPAE